MKELKKHVSPKQGTLQVLLKVAFTETTAPAGTVHTYKEINDKGMVF